MKLITDTHTAFNLFRDIFNNPNISDVSLFLSLNHEALIITAFLYNGNYRAFTLDISALSYQPFAGMLKKCSVFD